MISLHPAISKLERAALEPSHWPTALSALGEAYGARIFALLRIEESGADRVAPVHAGDHMQEYVRGDWFERDPRGRRVLSLRPNRITNDDEILAEGERETADFYRDFAASQDVPFVTTWRVDDQTSPFFFTAMRSAEAGPATLGERRRLAAIREHANSAAILSASLGRARTVGMLDGLELADRAVIALNRNGKAIAATARGATLLTKHFVETDGRLATTNAFANAQIKRALERQDGQSPQSFMLRTPGARGALCTPIRNASENAIFCDVGVLLHLRDLEDVSAPPAETLGSAFGLTPAEVEVARLIAGGWSVEAIARERGSAIATVRTILAALFRKTGAGRQAELALLLTRMAK